MTSDTHLRTRQKAMPGQIISSLIRRLARLDVQRQDPDRSKVAGELHGMTSGTQLRTGGNAARQVVASLADPAECERFLVHEAWLLDDARFDEWLALYTEDARYWVPSEPGQTDPLTTVSLMYDDRRLLETRVRRLASPRIYSQEPRSRTSRVVGNFVLQEVQSDGKACSVRSKFLLLEARRHEQRMFGGSYLHRLVLRDGVIRIASKRVDLINCDMPLDGLVVPF